MHVLILMGIVGLVGLGVCLLCMFCWEGGGDTFTIVGFAFYVPCCGYVLYELLAPHTDQLTAVFLALGIPLVFLLVVACAIERCIRAWKRMRRSRIW